MPYSRTYYSFNEKEVINDLWSHSSSRLGFVTTFAKQEHNVLTVEWVTQVQFRPPKYAISLVKGYHSIKLLSENPQFCLIFASEDQVDLLLKVGRVSGKDVDKYGEFKLPYTEGHTVTPRIIEGGVMALECQIRDIVELEKAIIFVGEVVVAHINDKLPVGYHKGSIYKYGKEIQV